MKLDLSNICGITDDSRKVKRGFLFAAINGVHSNGCDFIDDAIKNGASVILAPTGAGVDGDVKLIESDDVRADFSKIARSFYGGKQPDIVVGVTGTNGKTSVVQFVRQIWEMSGESCASLGTLDGTMTTLPAQELHKKLAELNDQNVDHLAIEASSHGLDQKRVDGVLFSAAGFTNITRDHMDYHGDFAKYKCAKSRLFKEILPKNKFAVINLDSPQCADIANLSRKNIITYGRNKDADLRIDDIERLESGQKINATIFGHKALIKLNLIGEFQAYNVLCAFGLVVSEYIDDTSRILNTLNMLEKLEGINGRMQRVLDSRVYVDYAHTPDGLKVALSALRQSTKGRVICVFGCGGERDTGKREKMGAIAKELADIIIVTDDNPRGEDAKRIRKAILSQAGDALEIPNRGQAIRHAVGMLQSDDTLLVAGKGHEEGQEIKGKIYPFNDFQETRKAIQENDIRR